MSVTYISTPLRQQTTERAMYCCEYCRIHRDDMPFGGEVDHIISEKHGGTTSLKNLAFSCFQCNRNKGSDIASFAASSGILTQLFHPRRQVWRRNFAFDPNDDVTFLPLTPVGEVTLQILRLNTAKRVLHRFLLHSANRYPGDAGQQNPQ